MREAAAGGLAATHRSNPKVAIGGAAFVGVQRTALSTAKLSFPLWINPSHLPNPDRVQADYAVLAELSKGLSGGDILNVCVNAIYAGSVDADPAKWAVTQGYAGAGDWQGAEGEGGALREEARAEAEDWVSVIRETPCHEDAPCKFS